MKPVATLSLDLDNKWSYLKTHGDAGWDVFPSYLDTVTSRILKFLKRRGLTITFFVVGQDAALVKNHQALRAIADHGHEIGNHSFHHEPWLHLYSEKEIDAEITRAEEHIERTTERRPLGFRGPGYSLSAVTLRVLARRGYKYDATTFPNALNPLARFYYFFNSNLTREERKQRKALFGTFGDALRPLDPYGWVTDEGTLIEIPVTTMPIIRTPVHFTYLLWLSTFSVRLARAYFAAALRLCRWTSTAPSLLLHPLDFMGGDDDQDLAFFPGMNMTSKEKLVYLGNFIDSFIEDFRVVPLGVYAETASANGTLRLLHPAFPEPDK